MSQDFILLIIIIILASIISYSLYKQFRRKRDGFDPVKLVDDAIKDVAKFGKDIGDVGKQVYDEIRNVDKLGDDIIKLGEDIAEVAEYPIELGEKLGKDIADVTKQGVDFIEDEFNEITDAVEDFAEDTYNEIENAANSVKTFAEDQFDDIYGELADIGDTIADIPEQVADLAEDIFLGYIPDIFMQGWEYFQRYVLDPIVGVFREIGGVFEIIGDVFMEIINKLLEIPMCVPIYMYDISYEITLAVLKTVTPGWIKDTVRFINNNIIQTLVIPIIDMFLKMIKFIMEIMGFNFKINYLSKQRDRCYDFGPLNEIFEAFIDVFEMAFKGIGDLFKMINIDEIISEMLKVFT